MRRTPQLPSFVTQFALPGYTNAHQLCPGTKELYVTERLREHYGVEAGDWDAPVLLLAKDAAPTDLIRDRIARGESMPWRPSSKQMSDRGGVRTNKAVTERIRSLGCNVLYGSALANLMSDTPGMSRSLDGFYKAPLQPHLQSVLRWVMNQMPNLRLIACMGAEAWFVTTQALGHAEASKEWSQHRDAERSLDAQLGAGSVAVTAHCHPAARLTSHKKNLGWNLANGLLLGSDRAAA